jgi:aspartyl-tRNA(Asn)/glutamyl-tRNA(Gln) amidotransferase subunit A
MGKLHQETAHTLTTLIDKGAANPSQIITDIFERVDAVEERVKAFALQSRTHALASAKGLSKTKKGRLYGIPVLVKDNMCVKGEDTTCSSKILKNFKPPYDATVVAKLRDEGAVMIGKANMDEFAFGSSCETSCYGPTRNPWDLDRIPGGSSGGSTAAVAADETILALGSDTGGSIRQPASLCGVVGMKPTYGRVSRYGLIAFASSLDQIGPVTKDVEDAATLLGVIAGHDPMDSTSVDLPVPDYTKSLVKDIKGLRIGVAKEYFTKGIDPEVDKCVRHAIDVLKGLGASIVEISLPHTQYAVSTYYIIGPAEASSNLARFDGVQYGDRAKDAKDLVDMYIRTRSHSFGNEAKRRILLGTYCLSTGYYDAYYLKALKVRTKIKEDFAIAFSKSCDCIATPTSPTAAFKVGERSDDPLGMYLSDIFTISANLAGLPAISVPCGFTVKGLPIGLQIIGDAFCEEKILRVAYAFEQSTEHHLRKPNLAE